MKYKCSNCCDEDAACFCEIPMNTNAPDACLFSTVGYVAKWEEVE